MNFFNNLFIKLTANKIGNDEFGNLYYEAKKFSSTQKKKKRFVIYNGHAEASKIPAEWHGWMHYYDDNPPIGIGLGKRPWQKIHLPNLTGTIYRHLPSGSLLAKGQRVKVSSDYQSWNPKN